MVVHQEHCFAALPSDQPESIISKQGFGTGFKASPSWRLHLFRCPSKPFHEFLGLAVDSMNHFFTVFDWARGIPGPRPLRYPVGFAFRLQMGGGHTKRVLERSIFRKDRTHTTSPVRTLQKHQRRGCEVWQSHAVYGERVQPRVDLPFR